MSTVTDTEILALRARNLTIDRIVTRTGVTAKRVRNVLLRHGLLRRKTEPTKSELRATLDQMRLEMRQQRLIIAGQAEALDQVKNLLGALALDLTDALPVTEDTDDAPVIAVPPLPARRVRLSRTHRILEGERRVPAAKGAKA